MNRNRRTPEFIIHTFSLGDEKDGFISKSMYEFRNTPCQVSSSEAMAAPEEAVAEFVPSGVTTPMPTSKCEIRDPTKFSWVRAKHNVFVF
jgi:hypothetical protein